MLCSLQCGDVVNGQMEARGGEIGWGEEEEEEECLTMKSPVFSQQILQTSCSFTLNLTVLCSKSSRIYVGL